MSIEKSKKGQGAIAEPGRKWSEEEEMSKGEPNREATSKKRMLKNEKIKDGV